MSVIELKNINKDFGKGISKVQVLRNVNFQADRGELSLILGPSGSGKSTFLTIAGGLQTPTSGTVTVEGQQLEQMTAKERDELRLNKIGFVLQSYNLLPYLNVGDQFALVRKIKKNGNMTEEELRVLLKELGIETLLKHYPDEMSGGQNQRVAIARALYPNPEIVLADEPTAALDSSRVEVVGELLKQMAVQHNKAIVVVTHDLRLRNYADHIYQIMDGKLSQEK
ncbi:ABC transporter ATP-binding protein [Limosilactobacillus viscerum]|uniref:ABC transporter ATP-binding protein n=1 Tax=Limosilactobacillus viscerum TaxID=2993450 RepID=UPI0024B8B433|nr:ABC transporter ATP-binding protein [Limosilactobacillus viscerum]